MADYPGCRKRFEYTYTDFDGAVMNPDAITVKVRSPLGEITAYSKQSMTTTGTGVWYIEQTLPISGDWVVREETSGNHVSAHEQVVPVERSKFV